MGHVCGTRRIKKVDYPYLILDEPLDENWSNGLYLINEHVSKQSILDNFHEGDYILMDCQESEDHGSGWACKIDRRHIEYGNNHDDQWNPDLPIPQEPEFNFKTCQYIATDIAIGIWPRFRTSKKDRLNAKGQAE